MFKNYFAFIFLFLICLNKIQAATCSAIASSNWTLASTWSCGRVPNCNDVITIPSGYTVTISSAINLTGGGCSNTSITVGGILFFSGNASKLDLVASATITINSGAQITTDQPGNNSQKITIGTGTAEWSSNDGNVSGPWVIKNGVSTSALPVELTDFSGECISKGVQLNWSTISEENNDFFLLESSKDGLIWAEVAKVKGAGTVGYFKKYVHTDYNNNNGLRYYRLSQVDFDKTKKH